MLDLSIDKAMFINPYEHRDEKRKVKSVTEILSLINEPYIANWANSLGFKRISYSKELQRYADSGTKVHGEIEDFLTNGTCLIPDKEYTIGFLSFLNWYKNTIIETQSCIDVKLIEQAIMGKYFCGTLDALMVIGGKLHVVDFKTSANISYKHFMQLSAYNYLLRRLDNPIIPDCLSILQVNKNNPRVYNLHTLDCVNDNDKISTLFLAFLDVCKASYNVDLARETISR